MITRSTPLICPVSRNQPVANSLPARQQIVAATNLSSAVAALNQINIVLQQLKLPPALNNLAPASGGGPVSGAGLKPSWVEVLRNVEYVLFYPPGTPADTDNPFFVMVPRITRIKFREQASQVALAWDL